jgi:hypothetical protein
VLANPHFASHNVDQRRCISRYFDEDQSLNGKSTS